MVTIDYEIVHRIYKVAVQGQAPVAAASVTGKAVEVHPQVEIGGVEQEAAEVKVKVERAIPPPDLPPGDAMTKVTIERGGEVIAQETYGDQGQLTKAHGKIGRNDPCWCGSGRKYKRCHYPN